MGSSKQEYCSGLPSSPPGNHVLSELSTVTHLSGVALHGLAHSFIESCEPLGDDKAVIQEGRSLYSSFTVAFRKCSPWKVNKMSLSKWMHIGRMAGLSSLLWRLLGDWEMWERFTTTTRTFLWNEEVLRWAAVSFSTPGVLKLLLLLINKGLVSPLSLLHPSPTKWCLAWTCTTLR